MRGLLKQSAVTPIVLRPVLPGLCTAEDSGQIRLYSFECKSNTFAPDTVIDPQHYSHRFPYCIQDLADCYPSCLPLLVYLDRVETLAGQSVKVL